MKRLLFIAVAGVFLTSCSKDYSCECVSTKETTTFPMAVSRKSDANDKCLQYERQYNSLAKSVTDYYDCKVK